MENDENSIRLCLFFFSRKMIDITLQTLGFTCSGQVRGFNSIIAVYPDKYSSTLTLQERLTSNTIKLLFVWERKIADANVGTSSIGEGTGETTSAIEFSIIDKLGGVSGTLKSLPQITSYAQRLNAAYRESLEKLAALKLEYEKLSEQHLDTMKRQEYRDLVDRQDFREAIKKIDNLKLEYKKLLNEHQDTLNGQVKKIRIDKIKEGMAKASLKMKAKDNNGCFISEKIEKTVTKKLVEHIQHDCNTPQKICAVMNNLVGTFPIVQTDITLAKLTLADNFITYFKVLYTLVQCFPKQKDFSPDAVNFRELEGKLKNVLLMAVGPTGKQGHSCKKNRRVLKLLEMNDTSLYAKCATDRRALLENSCHTHMQINEHNKRSVETVGHKVLHRFFQQPTRKHRKDKLTEKDITKIEEAWLEMSEVSPNTNDQITRRDWNGTETKHFRYNCFSRVVDITNHLLNVKHLTYSECSVRLHKPFNVRKGKNDTCMCSVCENIGLLQKAVMRNTKIFNRPTRLVKAYRVLSLLAKALKLRYTLKTLEKVVSVRHCFIIVTTLFHCYYDYPVQTIVDVCRGAHRSQMCQRLMCNKAMPKYGALNKKECGRSNCLGEVNKKVVCVRCSKSQNMLLHEDIKADESDRIVKLLKDLDFRASDQSEKEWTQVDQISYAAWANEEGTKVESLLKVYVKAPILFVNYFKEKIYDYAHHVNVLTRQRNNAVLFQKNAQPHQLVADIDFSQNFEHTAAHRNQIQSAHWTGESTTLFTTVFRYLDLPVYQDTSSTLLERDEVSFFDKSTNLYHHAIVLKDWSPSTTDTASYVKVILSDINISGVNMLETARQNLHRRVWIAEPHITASNDKLHDTSFVQHFLQHVALGEHGFVKSHPVLKDQISEFHIHSDGAPGHFKQKYTLQSLNDLLIRNIPHGIKRILWEFGCPGHGKGVHKYSYIFV